MSSGEPTSTPPPQDAAAADAATPSDVPPVTPPQAESGTPHAAVTEGAQQGGAEWPAQAADAVVDLVGRVRDATTGPALTVMRGVVYGTAILVLGVTALVILVVGGIRTLDTLLPQEVWSAYLLLGLVFTAVGLVLWRKRRSPDSA